MRNDRKPPLRWGVAGACVLLAGLGLVVASANADPATHGQSKGTSTGDGVPVPEMERRAGLRPAAPTVAPAGGVPVPLPDEAALSEQASPGEWLALERRSDDVIHRCACNPTWVFAVNVFRSTQLNPSDVCLALPVRQTIQRVIADFDARHNRWCNTIGPVRGLEMQALQQAGKLPLVTRDFHPEIWDWCLRYAGSGPQASPAPGPAGESAEERRRMDFQSCLCNRLSRETSFTLALLVGKDLYVARPEDLPETQFVQRETALVSARVELCLGLLEAMQAAGALTAHERELLWLRFLHLLREECLLHGWR